MKTVRRARLVWVRLPLPPQKRRRVEKTIEEKIKFITDYCERSGISISVNRNPSPEEVKRIKSSIKRTEELEKFFVERYKEGS